MADDLLIFGDIMKAKILSAVLAGSFLLTACGEEHHAVKAVDKVEEAQAAALAKAPKAEEIVFDDAGQPPFATPAAKSEEPAATDTTAEKTAEAQPADAAADKPAETKPAEEAKAEEAKPAEAPAEQPTEETKK